MTGDRNLGNNVFLVNIIHGEKVTLQVNLKSIYLFRNGSIHASTHSVWKEMQILATNNFLLICGTG